MCVAWYKGNEIVIKYLKLVIIYKVRVICKGLNVFYMLRLCYFLMKKYGLKFIFYLKSMEYL